MNHLARHFEPGDLDVDTAPQLWLVGIGALPSRDYQVVTSPTAQHRVKQTGQAGAAASAASAIQGLLRCQAAGGAAAAMLTEQDALAVRG